MQREGAYIAMRTITLSTLTTLSRTRNFMEIQIYKMGAGSLPFISGPRKLLGNCVSLNFRCIVYTCT
jgi:hypothetical protein